MPYTSAATAAAMTIAPATSKVRASASRDVVMVVLMTIRTSPAPAKAQKIDCQGQKCSSTPDPSMPNTPPQPAIPAQMPTALVRWSAGYEAVIRDSVAGMMKAAPTPATARAPMMCKGSVLTAGTIEAAAKMARPNSRAPRRP